MRTIAAVLAVLFLAVPVSAQQLGPDEAKRLLEAHAVNAHPAECARLRRQIDHVSGMHQRARTLGNELWETRLEQQLELMYGMQASRCPKDIPVDEAGEAFMQFLKLAAKAAVTYFTFGAAGF